jgi:hypothetical protein
LLNYEPRIDLQQAVREFAVWFRQEGVFTSSTPAVASIPLPSLRSPALQIRRAA